MRVVLPVALALAACTACDDPREPPRYGLMEEPVACLDKQAICAGMNPGTIDQWIASGGTRRITSANCSDHPYVDRPFSNTQDVLKWCAAGAHIFVEGRTVNYVFIVSDGKIASIKIERRGTFP